jgi:signal transduction histidine kinase
LSLDRTRLRLLIRNLLDNALRHSADAVHPPEVSLSMNTDGTVQLTVRDHGTGVPEDQLPQLAQPFYRPDTARTREGGGVGLGLYLCRLVALAHGGSFTVRNAQPGLAVGVSLPAGGYHPGYAPGRGAP